MTFRGKLYAAIRVVRLNSEQRSAIIFVGLNVQFSVTHENRLAPREAQPSQLADITVDGCVYSCRVQRTGTQAHPLPSYAISN